jgi:hypothetical protein
MFKKLLSGLLLAVLLVSNVPVLAAKDKNVQSVVSYSESDSIVFEKTVTITEKGGEVEVGFVTVKFHKDFLPKDQYPKTFTLKIFAKDGEVGIDVTPDTQNFSKPVQIKVDSYKGFLYDEVKGENIYVNVKNQTIVAKHFSWYRFR